MIKNMAVLVFFAITLICVPAFAEVALHDLAVVNIGPVRATVFFRTDAPCIGKVVYTGADGINRLAQEESATVLHAVEIKDLEETSAYRFRVRLAGADGSKLGEIVKDEFEFKTARHSLAMPANIYGLVTGTASAAVIVVFRSAATGETSLPLVSFLDEQNRWTVNLGDAKGRDGMAMGIARGDVAQIRAIDSNGATRSAEAVITKKTVQKVDDLIF